MCLLCVSCLVSCIVSRTHKSLSSHLACYSKFSRSHTTPKFASHPHTLVGYSSHSLVYVYVLRAVDSLTVVSALCHSSSTSVVSIVVVTLVHRSVHIRLHSGSLSCSSLISPTHLLTKNTHPVNIRYNIYFGH
jgi:hypothetical protein